MLWASTLKENLNKPLSNDYKQNIITDFFFIQNINKIAYSFDVT